MNMKLQNPLLSCLTILLGLSIGSAIAADDGGTVYKKLCVRCHGTEGKGDGPAAKLLKNQSMGDLTSKAGMSKFSDQDLLKLVAEGGAAAGKSKVMPAHKDKLSEGEIKAVVAYVKTFQK